jgi:hypothetical protein
MKPIATQAQIWDALGSLHPDNTHRTVAQGSFEGITGEKIDVIIRKERGEIAVIWKKPKDAEKGDTRRGDGCDAPNIQPEFVITGSYDQYGISVQGFVGNKFIFIENDTVGLEQQREIIAAASALIGAELVSCFSGGKSIHSFWRLDRQLPLDEWRLVMRALLALYGGDYAIISPARKMRFPGAFRPDKQATQTIESFDSLSTLNADTVKMALLGALADKGITEAHLTEEWSLFVKTGKEFAGDQAAVHREFLVALEKKAADKATRGLGTGFDQNFSPINDEALQMAIAAEILTYIPSRVIGESTYDIAIKTCAALKGAFGDNSAIALAEYWSPSYSTWDVAKTIDSLTGTNFGALINLGRTYGWDERQSEPYQQSLKNYKAQYKKSITFKQAISSLPAKQAKTEKQINVEVSDSNSSNREVAVAAHTPVAPQTFHTLNSLLNADSAPELETDSTAWCVVGLETAKKQLAEKQIIVFSGAPIEGAIWCRSGGVPDALIHSDVRSLGVYLIIDDSIDAFTMESLKRWATCFIDTKFGLKGIDLVQAESQPATITHLIKQEDLIDGKYRPGLMIPPHIKLVVDTSGMGRGKTSTVSDLLEHEQRWQRPIVSLVARQSLVRQQAKRFGFTNRYNTGEQNLAIIAEHDGYRQVTACFDQLKDGSSMSIDPTDYPRPIVLLDEVTSGIEHVVSSGTIAVGRITVQQKLQYICQSAELIYAMDANATQRDVDMLSAFAGIKPEEIMVIGIENDQFTHRHMTMYDKKEDLVNAALAHASLLEEGQRIFIAADARKTTGENSTACTETIAARFEADGYSVLRVDQHTLSITDSIAYAHKDNLAEAVKQYQIIVCSPSVETGISFDKGSGFVGVYGALHGVVSIDIAKQMLERVREDCQRHVWLAPVCKQLDSYTSAKSIAERERAEEAAKKDHIANMIGYWEAYTQATALDEEEIAILETWRLQREVTIKAGGRAYKVNAEQAFRAQGYTISGSTVPADVGIKVSLGGLCLEIKDVRNHAIADAEPMLCTDEVMTQAQWYGNEHYKIKSWLNTGDIMPVTAELIDTLTTSVKMTADTHTGVFGGSVIDDSDARSLGWQFAGLVKLNVWGQRVVNKTSLRSLQTKLPKIQLLREMGVAEIIHEALALEELTWHTPIVQKLHLRMVANAENVTALLGIKVQKGETFAFQNFRHLIGKVGYKTNRMRTVNVRSQDGVRITKERYYTIELKHAIFEDLTNARVQHALSVEGGEANIKAINEIAMKIDLIAGGAAEQDEAA